MSDGRPAPRLQPDRAEYTSGLPEIPDSPEAPTAGAPGVESEDVRAYPVQTPASQYQSYMLKVQTRSFGCTPWSRVVSLLTTTCW
jgi:hypothetical protein